MSKKIISFLGTGNYKDCVYSYGTNKSTKVTYIQEAIAQFYGKSLNSTDSICIFLTPEAREKHWQPLQEALSKLNLKCQIKTIDIEYSKTETDIWKLYSKLYDAIDPDEKIYFDVTHSFRYLPMIFFSILKYAQYLKNIKVQKILYGAFEMLDDETEIVPIIDLTNAYKVLKWAEAAEEFNQYGSVKKLENMTQSDSYDNQKELIESIVQLTKDLDTARALEITKATNFTKATRLIKSMKNEDKNNIFYPILQTIYPEISQFKENSTANFIPAVQWYINHSMLVQGFVILREGTVSYILDNFGIDYNRTPRIRNWFSKGLAYKNGFDMVAFEEFTESDVRNKLENCIKSSLVLKIKPTYEKLAEDRNNIEHGGYLKKGSELKNQQYFKENLQEYFSKIKAIVIENENEKNSTN